MNFEENSEKLSFCRWIQFYQFQDTEKIRYGTAGQIRTNIVNIDEKKLNIVDLIRAKGENEKEENLLVLLEDCKNKNTAQVFRNLESIFLIKLPPVIVLLNYLLQYNIIY